MCRNIRRKKTSELIPLCHNINLSDVNIDFKIDEKMLTIKIQSEVSTVSATGVEMEALTSCIIASLTIYDMCKSIDKKITIETTKLIYKSGGKSVLLKMISFEKALDFCQEAIKPVLKKNYWILKKLMEE